VTRRRGQALRNQRSRERRSHLIPETAGAKGFSCKPITINRQIKFAAENFQTADVIGVFVRENHAIELLSRYTALLETQDNLSRAQSAIYQDLAVVGCHQGVVPRAPAAEHGQGGHGVDVGVGVGDAVGDGDGVPVGVGFPHTGDCAGVGVPVGVGVGDGDGDGDGDGHLNRPRG
jgi:hypothetical protein